MKVTRYNLRRVYGVIYERALDIEDKLRRCGGAGCFSCPYSDNVDCYADIAADIIELNRLLGVVANGVKKITKW